jgi:hypothetical protein
MTQNNIGERTNRSRTPRRSHGRWSRGGAMISCGDW